MKHVQGVGRFNIVHFLEGFVDETTEFVFQILDLAFHMM